jgi:hypothetical protein
MFTFGREHELKCALRDIKSEPNVRLITQVVEAVHDLLEGKSRAVPIQHVIIEAFSFGGSGVWERTGDWLRQLSRENPEMLDTWRELSRSHNGKVRFRVACFLNEMPRDLALEIGIQFSRDISQKVRDMAEARLEEIGDPKKDSGV